MFGFRLNAVSTPDLDTRSQRPGRSRGNAGGPLWRVREPLIMAGEMAAGRMAVGEAGRGFDLETCLRLGTVPAVFSSQDPESALAAYAALYVEQEVRAEGLARDIGSFSRLTTVAGYLELLEDLLLAFRLPVFTRRAKRRLAAHPRFFYFDCGVFRSLRPAGPLDRPEDLRGLAAFGAEYPEARRVLLYRGAERLAVRDILCLPVEDFLARLHPKRGLQQAVRA